MINSRLATFFVLLFSLQLNAGIKLYSSCTLRAKCRLKTAYKVAGDWFETKASSEILNPELCKNVRVEKGWARGEGTISDETRATMGPSAESASACFFAATDWAIQIARKPSEICEQYVDWKFEDSFDEDKAPIFKTGTVSEKTKEVFSSVYFSPNPAPISLAIEGDQRFKETSDGTHTWLEPWKRLAFNSSSKSFPRSTCVLSARCESNGRSSGEILNPPGTLNPIVIRDEDLESTDLASKLNLQLDPLSAPATQCFLSAIQMAVNIERNPSNGCTDKRYVTWQLVFPKEPVKPVGGQVSALTENIIESAYRISTTQKQILLPIVGDLRYQAGGTPQGGKWLEPWALTGMNSRYIIQQ